MAPMSLLEHQLRSVAARINACEALALKIGNAGKYHDDQRRYLSESLAEAESSLQNINVKIVNALRREGKPTDAVLERHVSAARRAMQASVGGVLYYVDQLTDHFSEEGSASDVLILERLRKQARKIVRTLHLTTRPKLALFLSWRGLIAIIAGGLITTFMMYVVHYAIHPQTGLTAVQSVVRQAASDANTINNAVHEPDASFADRSLKTAGAILDLLPKLPKAIVALTATVAAIERLMAASIRPYKRR